MPIADTFPNASLDNVLDWLTTVNLSTGDDTEPRIIVEACEVQRHSPYRATVLIYGRYEGEPMPPEALALWYAVSWGADPRQYLQEHELPETRPQALPGKVVVQLHDTGRYTDCTMGCTEPALWWLAWGLLGRLRETYGSPEGQERLLRLAAGDLRSVVRTDCAYIDRYGAPNIVQKAAMLPAQRGRVQPEPQAEPPPIILSQPDVPKGFPTTRKRQRLWRDAYAILAQQEQEFQEDYDAGKSDSPRPTMKDRRDRLASEISELGKSENTIRNILKAGKDGWFERLGL